MVYFLNRAATLAVGIVFPLLGSLAVGLRFKGRLQNKSGLGVDDWLTIPALVSLEILPIGIVSGVALTCVFFQTLMIACSIIFIVGLFYCKCSC